MFSDRSFAPELPQTSAPVRKEGHKYDPQEDTLLLVRAGREEREG